MPSVFYIFSEAPPAHGSESSRCIICFAEPCGPCQAALIRLMGRHPCGYSSLVGLEYYYPK